MKGVDGGRVDDVRGKGGRAEQRTERAQPVTPPDKWEAMQGERQREGAARNGIDTGGSKRRRREGGKGDKRKRIGCKAKGGRMRERAWHAPGKAYGGEVKWGTKEGARGRHG